MKKYAGILTAALAVAGNGCDNHPSKPELTDNNKVNPHEIIVLDAINNNRMIFHECVSGIAEPGSLTGHHYIPIYKYQKNDPKSYAGAYVLNLGSGQIMKYEENSPYCKDESHKNSSAFDEKKPESPKAVDEPK